MVAYPTNSFSLFDANQVDKANRRGGRGRRSRKKTISDMSGMMGGPALPSPEAEASTARITVGGTTTEKKDAALAPVKENENLLRNPTKPGEFRKTTYDPFSRRTTLDPLQQRKPLPPPPPLA